MSARDDELAKLAGKQYQLWGHHQALELGYPKQTIHNRKKAGRWIVFAPKVYGTPHVAPSQERCLMAGIIALPDSAVSHESGAWLQGMRYVGSTRSTVTVPVRSTHRFPDVHVRESTDLTADQIVIVRGLPTTTVERTIADLAVVLQPGRFRRVVQDVLGRRLATWEDIVAQHERLGRRGKPGTALFAEVLASLGPGWAIELSELEWRFLELIERSHLPDPEVQFHLPWRQTPEGHVDFAWVEERLIVEVDGRQWHTRDEAMEEDIRREAEAARHGWQLQRFTWKQVRHSERFVLETVEARLAQRLVPRAEPA